MGEVVLFPKVARPIPIPVDETNAPLVYVSELDIDALRRLGFDIGEQTPESKRVLAFRDLSTRDLIFYNAPDFMYLARATRRTRLNA